jgi:hypothetical protein
MNLLLRVELSLGRQAAGADELRQLPVGRRTKSDVREAPVEVRPEVETDLDVVGRASLRILRALLAGLDLRDLDARAYLDPGTAAAFLDA